MGAYERTLYIYVHDGKIEVVEYLQSSKPLQVLTITLPDGKIFIEEIDNA